LVERRVLTLPENMLVRLPKTPRSGLASVELAAVLPLLALIFVATVDYARVFYYQQHLDNCARNGAVYASNLKSYQETGWVNPNNSVVNATLADGGCLNPALTSDQVTVTNGTGSDGNPNVTVTITYPFTPITRFPGFKTVNLQAKCSMRVAP
jgi:Flp pilus assembly protein TadG